MGKPQITEAGVPLTGFISAKAEALLYYLAVTGRLHSRETLADLLWGEMPEPLAKKNLTKALSNLRQVAGAYLTIDRHTAGFKPDALYGLDGQVFVEALESEEVEALQKAVDLYHGDFLESFYLKEAPAFEDWLRSEQERWRGLMLQTLERLVNRLVAGGEAAAAIEVTRRWLDLDPYQEAAYRRLMILLARSGQRSAALAVYDRCCRILAEEVGVEPSAETQTLYLRIKTGDGAPPHNLPYLSPRFVGRDVELAKVIALLSEPACRLLTLAGPGGIGKTRLALQAAAYYGQQTGAFDPDRGFPDGVYLVRLAPLDSIEAVISTLAEAIGFSVQPGSGPKRQILAYLQQKKLLLVWDSFEHFLPSSLSLSASEGPESSSAQGKRDGVSLITRILETAPGVKLLVTSRSRLNLKGEHLYYLAGMPVPDWHSPPDSGQSAANPPDRSHPADLLQQVMTYSAVQLFINQARQVQPEFELTGDNVTDVVQICRLVQGMPLGILLAAAWIELLTPAEIAEEIEQSLDFLETKMSDAPRRQQSIRAAFDYSWNLLTQREQDIFQQLSIFRGHFSRQAAQTVTGASLQELRALVNKSLLRPTEAERYAVHELLRQYAAEKLGQTADAGQATHHRHSAYYRAVLQQFAVDCKGPQQQAGLAEVETESENIRAAWHWAITHQQGEGLSQAMDGLGYFYLRRGRYQEGEAAFGAAAIAFESCSSGERRALQAKGAVWQAVFSYQKGEVTLAHHLLQKGLTLLTHLNLVTQETQAVKAFAGFQMGEISREANRQAARQWYDQSLDLYQALDDKWGMANTLAALGWLTQHLGSYDQAKQLYTESLTLRQGLEDRWGIANSLISLGTISLYQGYPQEAEPLMRQSITLHQKLGDRAGIAYSLSKLGETLIWLGRFTEAFTPLEESKVSYEGLGLRDRAAFALAMLALAQTHLGQYESAFQKAQLAFTHFQELGSRRGLGYALLVKGWAYLGAGQTTEAQQVLQESRSIYQEIGQRDELAQALALLGYAAYRVAEAGHARQFLSDGLHTATQIRAFMPMMLALPALACLFIDQGKLEQAIEIYALAARSPFVANSQWFKDMAGQPVAAISLPPDVLIAAQERGKTAQLEAVSTALLSSLMKR
ncbi:MAG TPA: BTAD domain-containing putative transcriptional regulator [Anaerolineae bacterium]|nr:BTAD domain-containing putative transcriptional regulator [Anaerolineae bacterium]